MDNHRKKNLEKRFCILVFTYFSENLNVVSHDSEKMDKHKLVFLPIIDEYIILIHSVIVYVIFLSHFL